MKSIIYTCDLCGKELGMTTYRFKMHKVYNDQWFPHSLVNEPFKTTHMIEICPSCWAKIEAYCKGEQNED